MVQRTRRRLCTCPVFYNSLTMMMMMMMMMIWVQRGSDEHVGGCDVDPWRTDVTRSSRGQLDWSRHNESSVDRHAGHPGRRPTSTRRRHHPAHGRRRPDGRFPGDGRCRELADHGELDQRHRLRPLVCRQSVTRSSAVQ